jgi:hypothetical protein
MLRGVNKALESNLTSEIIPAALDNEITKDETKWKIYAKGFKLKPHFTFSVIPRNFNISKSCMNRVKDKDERRIQENVEIFKLRHIKALNTLKTSTNHQRQFGITKWNHKSVYFVHERCVTQKKISGNKKSMHHAEDLLLNPHPPIHWYFIGESFRNQDIECSLQNVQHTSDDSRLSKRQNEMRRHAEAIQGKRV